MGLLSPGYGPHGVVAITTDLTSMGDADYVGDTETMVYQLPFIAAPKRIYRVQIRAGRADAHTEGDQEGEIIRYAKNSMVTRCRWASGPTVTTSGTSLGDYRVSVFDDNSTVSTGLHSSWILINPPAGQLTVGISIFAGRAAATYGTVRILTDGGAYLLVEDIGPYSE